MSIDPGHNKANPAPYMAELIAAFGKNAAPTKAKRVSVKNAAETVKTAKPDAVIARGSIGASAKSFNPFAWIGKAIKSVISAIKMRFKRPAEVVETTPFAVDVIAASSKDKGSLPETRNAADRVMDLQARGWPASAIAERITRSISNFTYKHREWTKLADIARAGIQSRSNDSSGEKAKEFKKLEMAVRKFVDDVMEGKVDASDETAILDYLTDFISPYDRELDPLLDTVSRDDSASDDLDALLAEIQAGHPDEFDALLEEIQVERRAAEEVNFEKYEAELDAIMAGLGDSIVVDTDEKVSSVALDDFSMFDAIIAEIEDDMKHAKKDASLPSELSAVAIDPESEFELADFDLMAAQLDLALDIINQQ